MGEIEKVGNLKSQNISIKNHRRNMLVLSKFLHSGWRSLWLMNRYNMRHFSNDLIQVCLSQILKILISTFRWWSEMSNHILSFLFA